MPSIEEGIHIATDFDVATNKDGAVLYSVSYQKTKKNRDDAYLYVNTHKNCQTLDHTPCGKTLCERGYQCTNDVASDVLKKIWKIASERFVAEASGNITAFVDNADQRSTFCMVEIPAILKNEKIITVNGIDKFVFLKKFEK